MIDIYKLYPEETVLYHYDAKKHNKPFLFYGLDLDEGMVTLLDIDSPYGRHSFPIKGLSTIHRHHEKYKARQVAVTVATLAMPIDHSLRKTDVVLDTMLELNDLVYTLTNEITPLSDEMGEYIKID